MATFRNLTNANREVDRLREACSTINEGWLADYERMKRLERVEQEARRLDLLLSEFGYAGTSGTIAEAAQALHDALHQCQPPRNAATTK